MLEVAAARKVFHRGTADAKVALADVDLALERGEFAVLIGPNGAGKTTLLNAVAGTVVLDAGTVRIGGVDVTRQSVERRAARVSRVFQDPLAGTAAAMTVEENLFLAEKRGARLGLGWALTAARREAYAERLAPFGLGLESRLSTRVEQLSGGQRQSLALEMAFMKAPDLVLLDEHTAALDPRTAQLVLQATVRAVAEAGVTALMVTHNMHHAIAIGTRLVMMEDGRIKLTLSGKDKERSTVQDLVARFETADDKILLAPRQAPP